MTVRTIKIGEKDIPVPPIPLKRVRRLPVVINRAYAAMARGDMDDAVTNDILLVLHLGTGLPEAELDEMPGTFEQLQDAMEVIIEVAGLKARGAPGGATPGEAPTPVEIQTAGGMTSTPTSSPAQDGPGSTSTTT